jgi:hypothetical protein
MDIENSSILHLNLKVRERLGVQQRSNLSDQTHVRRFFHCLIPLVYSNLRPTLEMIQLESQLEITVVSPVQS